MNPGVVAITSRDRCRRSRRAACARAGVKNARGRDTENVRVLTQDRTFARRGEGGGDERAFGRVVVCVYALGRMHLVAIESITDPRVSDYANLRDAELLQRDDPFDPAGHRGLFMAEGELVVRRLLASPFRTRSVFLTPTRLETMRDALEPLGDDVPVYLAQPEVLSAVAGFNIHRGVLAAGVRPRDQRWDTLLARPGPTLILEDLFNHDNIGSIFRNAAALAGSGASVLLSRGTADPLYRKCIRVSVGNVLSIPFARMTDFPDPNGRDARVLRESGVEVWALTPGEGATEIADAVREWRREGEAAGASRPIALMLGSEGPGLSEQAMALATRRVVIPMRKAHENVDSLNVGVAAAVALYAIGQVARQ